MHDVDILAERTGRILRLFRARACLQSSLDPKEGGNDVDHGGITRVGLFVACGDASEAFNLAEEILDEMTPLVFVPVMRSMPARPLTKWDDSLDVLARQILAQPVRVECLVADKRQTVDASHESIEARDVVAIARQKHEADQIAQCIDDRRDLRGRSAARFADGLFLSPPFAPVPCWWTRMCVASMSTYSKSGSSEKRLKTRSQVPFCAHRQNRV